MKKILFWLVSPLMFFLFLLAGIAWTISCWILNSCYKWEAWCFSELKNTWDEDWSDIE